MICLFWNVQRFWKNRFCWCNLGWVLTRKSLKSYRFLNINYVLSQWLKGKMVSLFGYESKTNIHLGSTFLWKTLICSLIQRRILQENFSRRKRSEIPSFGGKWILFQATSFPIPSYLLSVMKLPAWEIHATDVSYLFFGEYWWFVRWRILVA